MTVPIIENGHEPHEVPPAQGRKVVGGLACQQNTYLKELTTTVFSCEKNLVKKAPKNESYEVQLLDTILFPEGGGQPWDHGTLEFKKEGSAEVQTTPITKVLRRKLEAIHYSPVEIPPGTKVDIQLDFDRRFDHAQQHTGQHLLSAVLDTYKIPTLAWTMGTDIVYVEVGSLPPDLTEVERKCNQHIRDNLPITVKEVREVPDGILPADYDTSAGIIRIVSIGGIDANPCCGTHVKSTAELNSISILHTSTVPSRGTFRIHFVTGGRVQNLFSQIYSNSREMGATLSSGLDELPKKVAALERNHKEMIKKEKILKAEMVGIEAERLRVSLQTTGKALLVRTTADNDFLNWTLAALPSPLSGVVLMVAGDVDGGLVVVAGDEAKVKELSGKIKEALPSVKGGGKPSKFQGKAATFKPKDIEFLRSLLDS